MSMRLLIVFTAVMTTSIAGQVEHALTVPQCRADQRLWIAQLEKSGKQDNLPSVLVMRGWAREMMQCEVADANDRLEYYTAESEIMAAEKSHMENFLDRHGLWNDFLEEDKEGQR